MGTGLLARRRFCVYIKNKSVFFVTSTKLQKGDECEVKIGGKTFPRKFVAKGECCLTYKGTSIFTISKGAQLFLEQEKSVSLGKL